MKRFLCPLLRIPGDLSRSAASAVTASGVECPNCRTLVRSVDCKANAAGNAGGANSGGAPAGSAAGVVRHAPQQQQQQLVASGEAAAQSQRQPLAAAASGAWQVPARAAGAASRQSLGNWLMMGGTMGGCLAIAYV